MKAAKVVLTLLCATLLCPFGTGLAQEAGKLQLDGITQGIEKLEMQPKGSDDMSPQMRMTVDGHQIVFALNDSPAAQALYAQLPFEAEISNYASNEKIFYPETELDTSNTPLAGGTVGTLAYYAPWGDVVMFFTDFGKNGSLYELGQVVSGGEYISAIAEGVYLFEK